MLKYTVLNQGLIHFKTSGGALIKGWHFGIIKTYNSFGTELSPYIFLGGYNHQEAVLSVCANQKIQEAENRS